MDDLILEINDLIENANVAEDFLGKADRLEKRATEAFDSAYFTLDDLQSVTTTEEYYEIAIGQTLAQAPQIYQDAVQSAVEKTIEYAYAPFLIPLMDIANNEGLYQFIENGESWNRRISVVLRMDEIAGTIDDYARAVDEAREEMGAKEDRDPAKASMIWRTKIWPTREKVGPYMHVIRTRLALKSTDAPFWSLLNYGNKTMEMSSNIGGTPYPSNGPTHFVENAELDISNYFKTVFRDFKIYNDRLIETLKTQLKDYSDAIARLREAVADMLFDIEKAKEIEARLRTKTLEDADPAKLLKAIEAAKAGKLTERVNVGRRGERLRLSPSTLRLYGD